MKDKRFLVFGFDPYYPTGGMRDLEFSFDTLQEASANLDKVEYQHIQIYDRIEGVIVYRNTTDGE
jgi:hypothetical protein